MPTVMPAEYRATYLKATVGSSPGAAAWRRTCKGAEPSLAGQHDARALGHGVVIGMLGGDTLASVRVRGPGLVAEVVDLSHRLDSWQVDGEAGGQGTLREMERHQHNLSITWRVSISFSQTNHDT